MKRAYVFVLFLLAISVAILACNMPANSDRIQRYLSGTQTAEARIQPAPQENASEPAEVIPENPPAISRCDLFTGLDLPVYLLDVYEHSPSLVIYVEFPAGVVGLEDGTDDGAPWEYSATLGDLDSLWCAVFEEAEHAGRLYCMLPLPKAYHNAAKPLTVQVNNCDTSIVSVPRQSVVVLEAPPAGSTGGTTGGTTGGSESEEGSEGIESILGVFGIFTTVCGVEPHSVAWAPNGYEEWCECMGGSYSTEVRYNMGGVEDGFYQYCTFP